MEAFFLDGVKGPLFSIYHTAARQRHNRLGLVYAPPFAEEMNRSRRMAAIQARRLAGLGVDVLLMDPFGTGDSGGDYSEADWWIWREDIKLAMSWLGARIGGRVGLWGLRLGAMLAAEVAADESNHVERLILWQPVLSGDRHLSQFLRLRLAASLNKESGRESTKDLWARLRRGEMVEVAGYPLAPNLANAISNLKLQNFLERLPSIPVQWLEISSQEQMSLPPASEDLVGALLKRGIPMTAKSVHGESFWAIQEITLAPQLLSATENALIE
jgi:exosortase A-associated hydrolase 2